MAVVLKEQLELRPSVALQKKVGLKSLEQVIRWGDRVNQELRRWRKLEDKKCWRAWARCIRKKSRGGSSRLSKAQALVEIEQQERGYLSEGGGKGQEVVAGSLGGGRKDSAAGGEVNFVECGGSGAAAARASRSLLGCCVGSPPSLCSALRSRSWHASARGR